MKEYKLELDKPLFMRKDTDIDDKWNITISQDQIDDGFKILGQEIFGESK